MKRGTALAASVAAARADMSAARADFPWAGKQTYLNTATEHPLSVHTTRAMEEYLHALTHGPVVPAANVPVTVSVAAADPDGIATMAVKYAVNGGAWQTADQGQPAPDRGLRGRIQ